MRNLISWLRSCFCKHEFEYNEEKYTTKIEGDLIKEGLKVARTCKKCGWHKSYWKY